MKIYNRITGESFDSDTDVAHEKRMARLRNRVWWGICNVSRETHAEGGRMVAVTLTYRKKSQWSPTQISEWVEWWRGRYNRAYVWVAELQKRGVMHYHFLSSLPDGERWSKEEYDDAWYHGFTWVTDEIENPMYIGKYLQKEKSKDGKSYPKGARIVGYSRPTLYLTDAANRERIASRLPHWVQGCLDKTAIRQGHAIVGRSRGGHIINGRMVHSPYSNHDLPEVDTVGKLMVFAYTGEWRYTEPVSGSVQNLVPIGENGE